MAERITGINRSTLWLAWKEVRAALRDATIRDVVDFIDYDIEPEVWINRLLWQVSSGAYEPRSPLRVPLSKIPGEMVGLLFFLLERLAIRSTYCDSPGIGLPIDEFEFSRTNAILILLS